MKIAIAGLMMLIFAQCKSQSQPESLKLFLPKDSEKPSLGEKADPAKLFTLILGEKNEIFYYTGNLDKGTAINKTDYKGVRAILKQKKKVIGQDIVVIIKPGTDATYQNTVQILDEMSINDIKKYALVDYTKEDAERTGMKPPVPVELYRHGGPAQKEETIDENKNLLLIVLTKQGMIEYGFGKGTKQKLTPLAAADSTKFGAKIKELINGQSDYDVIIKGDKDAKYPEFKTVIDALKANELYKFKMISTEE